MDGKNDTFRVLAGDPVPDQRLTIVGNNLYGFIWLGGKPLS